MSFSVLFDRFSDAITNAMGSTTSVVLHTVAFVAIFIPLLFGFSLDKILLTLTTVVSLEAIYLAIFIQRSVNKQSMRLEAAIDKIVANVTQNLEEPLDEVVDEIRRTVKETHQAVIKVVAAESDQVVKELTEHVTEETDELVDELKQSTHAHVK
jgi:low affinity Fe/Cu permease